MILQRAIGRRGGEYFYFFCRGRQEHTCDSRYLQTDDVEEAVARHYRHLRFDPEFIGMVRVKVAETIEHEAQATVLLRQHLAAELKRLDTKEENLLDLAEDGEVPSVKIRERLRQVRQQRIKLKEEYGKAECNLQAGADLIEAALDLLTDPEAAYRTGGPSERQMLNAALFEKLYVYEDQITDQTYRPPFDELVHARQAVAQAKKKGSTLTVPPFDRETETGLLASALLGGGSSKTIMVGDEGFEPPTSKM